MGRNLQKRNKDVKDIKRYNMYTTVSKIFSKEINTFIDALN